MTADDSQITQRDNRSQGQPSAHTRLLLRALEPYTAQLEERLAHMAAAIEAVRLETDRVHSDAQGRIDEVVANLTSVADDLRGLAAAWSAPMYMTNPRAFTLPAAEGGGLGFRRPAAEATPDADAFYRAFEDVFRGPAEHVRSLQREYIDMLPAGGLIADIGCGRGEFLSLLAAVNADRIGVDMDADMASVAATVGECEVVVGDGTEWLLEQPEGSLGAVFAAQVIEHMTAGEVERFLRAAYRALNPDHGVVIAETVNPYFIPAFRMFWVDLTHECLIYPEVALAMAQAIGFGAGDIHFPGGSGEAERDRLQAGAYALVARRGLADAQRLSLPAREGPLS
jgi:SAM-dependent methyltransferase